MKKIGQDICVNFDHNIDKYMWKKCFANPTCETKPQRIKGVEKMCDKVQQVN